MNFRIATERKYIAADASAPVTVHNAGGGTLYYGDQTVTTSSYEGSIDDGATSSFSAGRWFVASTDARVVVDVGDSNTQISADQRAALDAADSPSDSNRFATLSTTGSLSPDLDYDFDREDGPIGNDRASGAWFHVTGSGGAEIVSGRYRNTVANTTSYVWARLPRVPVKVEGTFSFSAGSGTDTAAATAAVVCSPDSFALNNLVHCISTRTGWSVQYNTGGGAIQTVASGNYASTLALDTQYKIAVEKVGATTIRLTVVEVSTGTTLICKDSTNAYFGTNWGQYVFIENQEQSNSPVVGWHSWRCYTDLTNADPLSFPRANNYWLPIDLSDGTRALAENVPYGRFGPLTDAAVLTSGKITLAGGMVLPGGVPVNRIYIGSGATALATATNQWACLTDQAGRVLAVSADRTNTAWAADTIKAFTLSTPFTPSGPTPVYVGLMVAATTVPSLMCVQHNAARYGWILNAGTFIAGDAAATGQTTPVAADASHPVTAAAYNAFYAVVG